MSQERPRRVDSLYGSRAPTEAQHRAFRNGEVPVAVYGLGEVGLPAAVAFAETTGNVTVVDIDPEVADHVPDGESPLDGLRATTDPAAAATVAAVHVVGVPTVLRGTDPDLSNLQAAVETIGTGLDPGDLVLVESTVPPGTCVEVVEPTLVAESGLTSEQFGLASCPERTRRGRALDDSRGTDQKVVGGRDDESERAARLVYDHVTSGDVLAAPDTTTAECVTLFEGVYHDVNVALANELARIADELAVDVTSAIDLANTRPCCDIHDPGVGVGHRIPQSTHFVASPLETAFPLLETAREVNDGMPAFAAKWLARQLEWSGVPVAEARVLLLGLASQPGVDETRHSPAAPLASTLREMGAIVYGTDPVVTDPTGFDLTLVEIDGIEHLALDGAVLVTAHPEFDGVDWDAFEHLVVVDGRNALDLSDTGHCVYTIGQGVTN